MENNEIMTNNEEIVETTADEIVEAGNESFKIIAGVGLAIIAGICIYKYIAKPTMVKFKAKRNAKANDDEGFDFNSDGIVDDEEIIDCDEER